MEASLSSLRHVSVLRRQATPAARTISASSDRAHLLEPAQFASRGRLCSFSRTLCQRSSQDVTAKPFERFQSGLIRQPRLKCFAKRGKVGSAVDVDSPDTPSNSNSRGEIARPDNGTAQSSTFGAVRCSFTALLNTGKALTCTADEQSSTANTERLQRSASSTAAPSSAEPEPAVHRSSTRPSSEELLQEWQEVKVLHIQIALPFLLLACTATHLVAMLPSLFWFHHR